MSALLREIAFVAILALASSTGSLAQVDTAPALDTPTAPAEGAPAPATAPPPPSSPTTGERIPTTEAEAPTDLTPEELKKIEESLKADVEGKQNEGVAKDVPDLSQVNLGQALPRALQSMNPDIAIVLDAAAAWFSTDEPLQLGGHDPSETGFNLQALELAIGSTVDPFFRFDSNLVFSQFGVEIEEVYATTLALPWSLQARAGQFLTRFGRANPTHLHQWHFADQPLVIGKFMGSEGNRGLGAEASWLAPLPWYVEIIASATNPDGECCARSYFGADDIGVRSPLDLVGTFALKQFFPFGDSLSLLAGLSAQTGANPTGNANRTGIYGVDLYLRYRPVDAATRWSLSLEMEAMLRSRQVPFDLLTDAGGYAQVVWQIDPTWETAARYELVSGTAGDTPDPLDPEWTGLRHRGAVQLTYYPSHFSRLRLQSTVDVPTWEDQPIFALIATIEVVVGAHGAHAY